MYIFRYLMILHSLFQCLEGGERDSYKTEIECCAQVLTPFLRAIGISKSLDWVSSLIYPIIGNAVLIGSLYFLSSFVSSWVDAKFRFRYQTVKFFPTPKSVGGIIGRSFFVGGTSSDISWMGKRTVWPQGFSWPWSSTKEVVLGKNSGP